MVLLNPKSIANQIEVQFPTAQAGSRCTLGAPGEPERNALWPVAMGRGQETGGQS